jgi:group I intron endonuclease
MAIIYKITSPSGSLYIGQTINLKKRINAYRCDIKKYNKDIKLHNSLRKYGWDAHVLEIIEEVPEELLNERERYWVAYYKTYCYKYPDGLNMTEGGDGHRSTWMHKTELRKWYSEKFTGEGNPFYGKRHTEESKKYIAEFMSQRNKKQGIKVPKWGIEKSRLKKIKAVLMYDLQGNFIQEFESCTDAGKFAGCKASEVSICAKGKRTQARGYVFRYKTDNYPLKIDVGVIKKQTVKRPVVTVLSGKMWEHPSAQEASEYFLIPKTTINRAAMYNNGRPIRTGHEFYYKDSLNQNRPHIVGPMSLNGNY